MHSATRLALVDDGAGAGTRLDHEPWPVGPGEGPQHVSLCAEPGCGRMVRWNGECWDHADAKADDAELHHARAFAAPVAGIVADNAAHVVECGTHFHVRVYHPVGGFVGVATFSTREVADYTARDLNLVLRAWALAGGSS